MDLNLIRQDINQKTADFRHYWQILVKNQCHFNAGNLKVFFQFFWFDFLHFDPCNNFCFCKLFAKGLKSEEERLKDKFWSSEMLKIGRGQHIYPAVAIATTFRVL